MFKVQIFAIFPILQQISAKNPPKSAAACELRRGGCWAVEEAPPAADSGRGNGSAGIAIAACTGTC